MTPASVLATKSGIVRDTSGPTGRCINAGRSMGKAVETSLKLPQIEAIAIYFLHRIDDAQPTPWLLVRGDRKIVCPVLPSADDAADSPSGPRR